MNSNANYDFLNDIVKDSYTHAKFLNTLSFLEYTGARKIVKSQDEQQIDYEILTHMAEEIRHALMFKKFSQKVYPNNFGYNERDVFCFKLTRNYLKLIDDFCLTLMDKELCYVAVSYVIEERAIALYRYYAQVLDSKKLGISLRALIGEEERHLVEMREEVSKLIDPLSIDKALLYEETIFNQFKDAVIAEMGDYRLVL